MKKEKNLNQATAPGTATPVRKGEPVEMARLIKAVLNLAKDGKPVKAITTSVLADGWRIAKAAPALGGIITDTEIFQFQYGEQFAKYAAKQEVAAAKAETAAAVKAAEEVIGEQNSRIEFERVMSRYKSKKLKEARSEAIAEKRKAARAQGQISKNAKAKK